MENHLGANIKNFRKNKGYTQEELAGMLGVTPQAVSRWESEAGLPDVSMIVPIAQTLGITTDALLGYQAQIQDENVAKRIFAKIPTLEDVSDPGRGELKVCEYLAEEVDKNPMNYDVMLKYVQQVAGLSYYIDMQGLLRDEPEHANAILKDGIRKGLNIIRYCTDSKKVNKAHYALAWIYIHMKDYDNAREHVNVLPSLEGLCIREEINQSLIFFEKGFDVARNSYPEFNRLLFDLLAGHIKGMTTHYCFFGTLEEALTICDWSEGILKAYASIPELSTERLRWVLHKLNYNRMSAYLRAGEKEKAEEVCETYLKEIHNNGTFSEDEYKSAEKEFREKIYIL